MFNIEPSNPWKITKNNIGKRMAESVGWDEETHGKGKLYKFRMYDDDDNLYYEGVSTSNSSFDPLDDYGMPNAGCTYLRYWCAHWDTKKFGWHYL